MVYLSTVVTLFMFLPSSIASSMPKEFCKNNLSIKAVEVFDHLSMLEWFSIPINNTVTGFSSHVSFKHVDSTFASNTIPKHKITSL